MDEAHVRRTFLTAYHTFAALELWEKGDWCLLSSFKHTKDAHHTMVVDIVRSNPLINKWFSPPEDFFHSLIPTILRNENTPLKAPEATSDASTSGPTSRAATVTISGNKAAAVEHQAKH